MGKGERAGMRGVMLTPWMLAIAGVVVAQSVAHLVAVLGTGHVGTFVDLDRSNGLPDVLSTLVLAAAAAGAAVVPRRPGGSRRLLPALLGGTLGALTLADLLHDGAHPSSDTGPLVIGLVVLTVVLIGVIGSRAEMHVRATVAVAVCLLAGSFFVSGLDRLDRWFQRERGDDVAEAQIVAKEDMELAGWALVGLALWTQALGSRAPAFRAPAASRPRGA